MGRGVLRRKHRGLAGIAVCALFAALSNVRESFDTNLFLESVSEFQSPHYVHSAPALDDDDIESIDFYGGSYPGRNDTRFAPRVVLLSALDFPGNHPPIQFPRVSNESSAMELFKDALVHADKQYKSFEREWFQDCEPVVVETTQHDNNNPTGSNKISSHAQPTCNHFHELNLAEALHESRQTAILQDTRMELLGEGSWRSVWKLIAGPRLTDDTTTKNNTSQQHYDNRRPPDLVLKLLHTYHEFDPESFGIHQMDAWVMDRLSASNYVPQSFGFCGQSVLTEAASSSGRDLIKTQSLSTADRLHMARDLARGLADLHALQAHPWDAMSHDSVPKLPLVFAHHDINPANIIGVGDGQIQWNDFNLGFVNRRYKNGNNHSSNINSTECPVPIRYEQFLWRSPEECANSSGTLLLGVDGRNTASQAADVYSLGNVLFYVLSRHQPWSHLQESNNNNSTAKLSKGIHKEASLLAIANAKIQGDLPNLPDRYLKRPGAKRLWEAVQMCYTHDPRLRPSARDIAEFLDDKAHS